MWFPIEQRELEENILQNLFHNLTPQTVVGLEVASPQGHRPFVHEKRPYPYEDGTAGMKLGQLFRGVELVLHADLVDGDGSDFGDGCRRLRWFFLKHYSLVSHHVSEKQSDNIR